MGTGWSSEMLDLSHPIDHLHTLIEKREQLHEQIFRLLDDKEVLNLLPESLKVN